MQCVLGYYFSVSAICHIGAAMGNDYPYLRKLTDEHAQG